MMTRKNFIALADAIKAYNNQAGLPESQPFVEAQIGLLAEFCESQNPKFNRNRWLAYISESGTYGSKRGKGNE